MTRQEVLTVLGGHLLEEHEDSVFGTTSLLGLQQPSTTSMEFLDDRLVEIVAYPSCWPDAFVDLQVAVVDLLCHRYGLPVEDVPPYSLWKAPETLAYLMCVRFVTGVRLVSARHNAYAQACFEAQKKAASVA